MQGIDERTDRLLKAALAEDMGNKDLTSSLIPAAHESKADAIFREDAILCGLVVIERIFRLVDDQLRFLPVANEGEFIKASRAVFYVQGKTRSILTAERLALNFLAYLSAIATKTRAFVDEVKGTKAQIMDTRKTTPLWRTLERYAVRTGGGVNHRFGLFDGVLLKDNHLKAIPIKDIKDIVKNARARFTKNIGIGIEVTNLEELKLALDTECQYILLDNFTPALVNKAVALRAEMKKQIPLEVSGGIRLLNVRKYAECGVERISVGALTHTIKSIDVSLNIFE